MKLNCGIVVVSLLGLLTQMSIVAGQKTPSPDTDNSEAAAGHKRDFESMDSNHDG